VGSNPVKVALTGGNGFIGTHLRRRLLEGGDSVTLIPRGVGKNDLEDSFRRERPDLVIHLASYFVAEHKPEDADLLVESNLRFPLQVLEAMAGVGMKRLLNTGTSWQHYRDADYNPVCLYAATKRAFVDLLRYYEEAHGFSTVSLELFDTYGPGDRRPKLIPKILASIRDGGELSLSPGEQKVDFTYVDDVVDAYVTAARRLTGRLQESGSEVFSVRSGAAVDLRELMGIVARATGREPKVRWGERPYREREVMTPWKGGIPLPEWRARTGLEEGLRRTWRAFVQDR
jgi:nucleoside-diphosphate-sugar epimerase